MYMSGGTRRYEFSAMRSFGYLLLGLGTALIIVSGVMYVRQKDALHSGGNEYSYDEDDEITDDALSDEEKLRSASGKDTDRSFAAFPFIGALMILAGVPLMYRPYADKGMRLRRRRRKKRTEEIPQSDPEFDYPDDDYDFIIRRETYELLHKQQLENIRKKHSRR